MHGDCRSLGVPWDRSRMGSLDGWDPSLPHDRNDRTGVSAEKRKKTVNSREDREIANTHLVFSKRQKKRPPTVFSQKDREIRKKDR